MKKAILICDDPDMQNELRQLLEKQLAASGQQLQPVPVTNIKDAEFHIDEAGLIVTMLHCRKDYSSPLDLECPQGLKFLQRVKNWNFKIPALLIIPDTPQLERVRNEAQVTTYLTFTVSERHDMDQCFADSLGWALKDRNIQRKYMKIKIYLNKPPEKPSYRITGMGFAESYEKGDELILNSTLLSALSGWARDLGGKDPWEPSFSEYGCRIYELLFEENKLFSGHVFDGLHKEGLGLTDTKLTFIVERGLHNLALESIKVPRFEHYWMLKAPVYRRLKTHSSNKPLFRDEETSALAPIRCLIIDANLTQSKTFDDINDDSGQALCLGPLMHVAAECKTVKKVIEKYSEELRIETPVRILRRAPEELEFSKRVEEELKSNEYQFVHFSGHSHFDVSRRQGYVFFQDRFITPVEIEKFADWLRRTRFLFMNSCQSATGDFVFELVRHRIPAVCGFRWNVNDEFAAEYASEFYRYLFKLRSLEDAFLKARVTAHKQHPTDRIWASSILVLQ